ncbi:MAG: VOC family protein [Clostridia bacterium]|nr:VOC family protein [Clostridia bacterium]
MANEILKDLGFHHIALRCADINKSLNMYKALGMTEKVRWGENENLIVMLDIGNGDIIELFANGGEKYAEEGKWQHFAMRTADVNKAYETAIKAGFSPLTQPKTVPLDSSPEKMTITCAFVKGPDGEQVEFFSN